MKSSRIGRDEARNRDGEERAPLPPVRAVGVVLWTDTQRTLLLAAMLAAGIWMRVQNISDHAFEFQPTRQYRSALIARDFFYRGRSDLPAWKLETARVAAKREGILEPPLMELLASTAYRALGVERLWVPRLLSGLFWCSGGLLVYGIAARLAGKDGAIIAAAFYWFQPFGVLASPSFQPDSLMILFFLAAVSSIFSYFTCPTKKNLLIGGSLAAMAMLVKPVCGLSLLSVFGAFGLSKWGMRGLFRQGLLWSYVFISLLPTICFYGYGALVAGSLSGQTRSTFLPHLWGELRWWAGWWEMIGVVVGTGAVIAAWVGAMIAERGPSRNCLVGLWAGYLLMGLIFNYHVWTHNYYHLILVPTIALSLSPVIRALITGVEANVSPRPLRVAATLLLTVSIGSSAMSAGQPSAAPDAEAYVKAAGVIGQAVNHSSRTIFLTWAYGKPLQYHAEIAGVNWPHAADLRVRAIRGEAARTAEERLDALLAQSPAEYFIVTEFRELEQQKDLLELLARRYPLTARTEEYLIFDLRRSLQERLP